MTERRHTFRVGLFQRRGLDEPDAQALAERLALRDQQRDDRRVCLECSQMQRSGHCIAVMQGRMRTACRPDQFTVMPRVLQRCPNFQFQKPA